MESSIFKTECLAYLAKLSNSFSEEIYIAIESLAFDLKETWLNGNQVFIKKPGQKTYVPLDREYYEVIESGQAGF